MSLIIMHRLEQNYVTESILKYCGSLTRAMILSHPHFAAFHTAVLFSQGVETLVAPYR